MGTHSDRKKVLEKILTLCKANPTTTKVLASLLNMNYNTLRSKYVYHLLEKDKLKRFKGKYTTK